MEQELKANSVSSEIVERSLVNYFHDRQPGEIHDISEVSQGLLEGFYEAIDLCTRCLILFRFSVNYLRS
jgi:hypothetical protein